MLRAGLLGLLMALVVALVGCLEGRAPLDEEGGAPGFDDQGWSVETWPVDDAVEPAQPRQRLAAEPGDIALCQAMADRERSCVDDEAEPFDVDSCASRYVCSRRLWREDIRQPVYACLRDLPCGETDPEFTCLREASAGLEPSTAQQTFEREAEAADELCGELLEVAPGQSDLVYESLTFCLTHNEGCDSKAACSLSTLDAMVDEICGAPQEGQAAQDA
jgi:hypothetical protein